MDSKQINVSMPLKLYEETEKYVKSHGYKNIQDLMLESVRNRVIFDDNLDDSLEVNEDYENEILKESDYLSVEESEKIHKKLMRKALKEMNG